MAARYLEHAARRGHLAHLIKHLEVGFIAAPSLAGVSDLDQQIDVRALVIALVIRHGMRGVEHLVQGAVVQPHLPDLDRAGHIAAGNFLVKADGLAMVARRVGIRYVLRKIAQAHRLGLHPGGGDSQRVGKVGHDQRPSDMRMTVIPWR